MAKTKAAQTGSCRLRRMAKAKLKAPTARKIRPSRRTTARVRAHPWEQLEAEALRDEIRLAAQRSEAAPPREQRSSVARRRDPKLEHFRQLAQMLRERVGVHAVATLDDHSILEELAAAAQPIREVRDGEPVVAD
jgi:hypothetical protein